jgi:hypothetical protein
LPPRTAALLRDIDTFLSLTGMRPTNLGKASINDPALYIKLKRGRRLWEETEERVRGFMSMYAKIKGVRAS